MVVKTIREGSGAVPLPTDTVKASDGDGDGDAHNVQLRRFDGGGRLVFVVLILLLLLLLLMWAGRCSCMQRRCATTGAQSDGGMRFGAEIKQLQS